MRGKMHVQGGVCVCVCRCARVCPRTMHGKECLAIARIILEWHSDELLIESRVLHPPRPVVQRLQQSQ